MAFRDFGFFRTTAQSEGQSVFHLHVHVIPRYPGVDRLSPAIPPNDRKDRDGMARRIGAAMK
ncbi:MAG: HIT domain-containing protein [Gemmatimonadaceae bacterium]